MELRSDEFLSQHLKLKGFAEPIQFCVRGFTLLKEATAIREQCFCFVTMLRQVVYVKVRPKLRTCLPPLQHPGVMLLRGAHDTAIKLSTWYKRKLD